MPNNKSINRAGKVKNQTPKQGPLNSESSRLTGRARMRAKYRKHQQVGSKNVCLSSHSYLIKL